MKQLTWVVGFVLLCGACNDQTTVPPEPQTQQMDGATDGPLEADGSDAQGPCSACTAGQICSQAFDGTCRVLGTSCVTAPDECRATGSCSAACEELLCPGPILSCTVQGSCGNELPGTRNCYGP